jgi:hypothetical protein
MEKYNIPTYEFVFDPENFPEDGLTAVSIVDSPAIMQDFVLLSEDEKLEKFKVQDDEKQILVGPAIIPGTLIFRNSKLKGQYYGVFKKETVKELVSYYFKTGRLQTFTYQHKEKLIKGLHIIESWFVDEKNDKSINLGYDLTPGTWMISVQVEDKQLWDQIKKDGLKGFSIEAFLDCLPLEMKSEYQLDPDELKILQVMELIVRNGL